MTANRRPARKVAISLRVDRKAIEQYRATGRGWQTRMTETIRRSASRLRPA